MYTKLFSLALLVSMVLTPMSASANTQHGEAYNVMSVEEKIAFLYGMIAQLQMLLEPSLMVGSVSESRNSRSDIDVTTLSATDIEDDEAELRGRVDLNGDNEARVWFEYGEDDDDFDERTSKRRVTDSSGDVRTFSTTIDDLDDDERYYYRAVAEDEDGDIEYGSVRSFETDDRSGNNSSSSNGDFELNLSDRSVEVGDRIEVDWEIPADDASSSNWIGLYRVGATNTSYLDWAYIENDDSGTETFELDDEGDFEFRLFLNNSYDDVVESDRFEVED